MQVDNSKGCGEKKDPGEIDSGLRLLGAVVVFDTLKLTLVCYCYDS